MNTNQSTFEQPAEPVQTVQKPSFTHDELIQALYWCYDIFERSGILFFAVFDTGKQIKSTSELSGDGVHIGVRRLEWESGGKRILDAFVDQQGIREKVKGNMVEYQVNGVPIFVHVFPEDECLNQLDTVMYYMEDFKLPNPYSRFEEVFKNYE